MTTPRPPGCCSSCGDYMDIHCILCNTPYRYNEKCKDFIELEKERCNDCLNSNKYMKYIIQTWYNNKPNKTILCIE